MDKETVVELWHDFSSKVSKHDNTPSIGKDTGTGSRAYESVTRWDSSKTMDDSMNSIDSRALRVSKRRSSTSSSTTITTKIDSLRAMAIEYGFHAEGQSSKYDVNSSCEEASSDLPPTTGALSRVMSICAELSPNAFLPMMHQRK